MGCNHFLAVRVNVTDWADGIDGLHGEKNHRDLIKTCIQGAINGLPIHPDIKLEVKSAYWDDEDSPGETPASWEDLRDAF